MPREMTSRLDQHDEQLEQALERCIS